MKTKSFNNKSISNNDKTIPNIINYADSTNSLKKNKKISINTNSKSNNDYTNIKNNYINNISNNDISNNKNNIEINTIDNNMNYNNPHNEIEKIIINPKPRESIIKNRKIEEKKKIKININDKHNNIINQDFEHLQNNDILPINNKFNVNLNLDAVESFLNSKRFKRKNNLKSIDNYTSRNDNRNFIDNQSLDTDIRVNNIDLFAKTRKNITDKNKIKNYSLNGKKLKSKKKDKKDENNSPLDKLYKTYYYKNHKNESLSQEHKINNVKRIAPAFGRTAYAFYEKKDNRDIGNSLYNNLI